MKKEEDDTFLDSGVRTQLPCTCAGVIVHVTSPASASLCRIVTVLRTAFDVYVDMESVLTSNSALVAPCKVAAPAPVARALVRPR